MLNRPMNQQHMKVRGGKYLVQLTLQLAEHESAIVKLEALFWASIGILRVKDFTYVHKANDEGKNSPSLWTFPRLCKNVCYFLRIRIGSGATEALLSSTAIQCPRLKFSDTEEGLLRDTLEVSMTTLTK